MVEQREGFYQFRRKLVVGYLVLCALLACLLGWKMAASYHADRKAAITATKDSARSMAAHVDEIIDSIDQSLISSALAISAMGDHPMTPAAIQPLLAASSRASDSRFWLLFIDAKGDGVVASNNLAVGGVSYADRSYFRDAAQSRADTAYIGGPAEGRVSRRRLFFLSRRVQSPSGKFLGVVVAPIDAQKIASVFDKARLGSDMSIALATSGSKIVARAPLFEESFGVDVSFLAKEITPSAAQAEFELTSPFSRERRLFSYAVVSSYPLLVIVGVTRDSWMSGFRAELIAGLFGVAIALIVALFSGRFALDQFRRLEEVEESQRTLIAQLGSAKEELARAERRLRVIADSVPARVSYINADERYTYHNAGESGAPIGALMGKTLLEAHGPELYEMLKDDIHRALKGERICAEARYRFKGEMRYFSHQYMPDINSAGRALGFYAMVTDITDFKSIQLRLSEMARIDPLTGLPNRAELLDRLETALARCRRTGEALACLYLDIDRFKEVNDTFGHSGGDNVLVEFSRRLRQCVRESDTVARLAGDEFVILLEGIDQSCDAERVGVKIIECMAVPFDIEGAPRLVTTSIGMVIANPLSDDTRSLLRAADEALYRAKRAGRNRVER